MKPWLVALLLAASPVAAESPQDQMFGDRSACYLRKYSRMHLEDHPAQRVTKIALKRWAPERRNRRYLVLEVTLLLRRSSEQYEGIAYCENEAGHLFCQLEGDGGSFTLEPYKDGMVRLAVTRDGMRFEGSQSFIEISGRTGDDRVFLLSRVPAGACP